MPNLFTDSESYTDFTAVTDALKGLDTRILEPDSILFRGDLIENGPPSRDYPLFIADVDTVHVYREMGFVNISKVTTLRPLILFELTVSNLLKLKTLYPDNPLVMRYSEVILVEKSTVSRQVATILNSHKEHFEERPNGKLTNIVLAHVVKAEGTSYLNQQMLAFICSLGFDGWICFPKTLLEKTPDTIRVYRPEIAICNPTPETCTIELLGKRHGSTFQKTEGGKRKKRSIRKTRKMKSH